MKTFYKPMAFTIIMTVMVMTSCISTEVLELSPSVMTTRSAAAQKQSIPAVETMDVEFTIENKTSLYLFIDNAQLCNAYLTDESTPECIYDPTLYVGPDEKTQLLYTTVRKTQHNAWNATLPPQQSTGSYLMVLCRMMYMCNSSNGYDEDKAFAIWCGDTEDQPAYAYIPVEINETEESTQTINVTIGDNLIWYMMKDGLPKPILREIVFDATIEDWDEQL